jgi:hypothetical protein
MAHNGHDERLVVAAATTTKRAASSRLAAAQFTMDVIEIATAVYLYNREVKRKRKDIGYILFYKPVLQTVCFFTFFL